MRSGTGNRWFGRGPKLPRMNTNEHGSPNLCPSVSIRGFVSSDHVSSESGAVQGSENADWRGELGHCNDGDEIGDRQPLLATRTKITTDEHK
jgi:hypothetical protein